jgi:hypothetical protein
MTKNKVLVPDHIAAELENDKAAETKKQKKINLKLTKLLSAQKIEF